MKRIDKFDITNKIQNNKILKAYGGSNGSKIAISINDQIYMIKFPPTPSKNLTMSYTNSCISEHIGSSIFNILNIKAQETHLFKANIKDKIKVVVACNDFTQDGFTLNEFSKIKNGCIESSKNGSGTELDEILAAIEEQVFIDSKEMKKFFWDIFVVDAYLGNFDRHNGNWGVLVKNNIASLAPVFDCGSCLFPQLDLTTMKKVLTNKEEMECRIYKFPTSAIKINGKKINYRDFLLNTNDKDVLKSIIDVGERIINKQNEINTFINQIPLINNLQKEFYHTMLKNREKIIIEPALNRAKTILKENNRTIKNVNFEIEK